MTTTTTTITTVPTITFPTPPPPDYRIIETEPFDEVVDEDNWDLFIEYWEDTSCPDCNGIDSRYCPTCRGAGEVPPEAR